MDLTLLRSRMSSGTSKNVAHFTVMDIRVGGIVLRTGQGVLNSKNILLKNEFSQKGHTGFSIFGNVA